MTPKPIRHVARGTSEDSMPMPGRRTKAGHKRPARSQETPLDQSPAHHSFFHTPRRLSSRDRNSSATQMAPVISPPRPSKTTMSTNEASQLESMCGPPNGDQLVTHS